MLWSFLFLAAVGLVFLGMFWLEKKLPVKWREYLAQAGKRADKRIREAEEKKNKKKMRGKSYDSGAK